MALSKRRQRHIIGDYDDESEEESLVPVLFSKGKEHVVSSAEFKEDS